MTVRPIRHSHRSLQRHLWAGMVLVTALVGGVGGWAATTEISGAVIAPGALVVDSYVKKVQHPTGGVVGEIRVRDGDRVRAGDIVVRLDETVTRANLAIVNKGLDELLARKARLEAERDGGEIIDFSRELTEREAETDVARIIAGERRLFELRGAARIGQKAQLGQRIAQLQEEIGGLSAQTSAKAQEIVLIERELKGARELWEKNLMPITKLTQLEREATRLQGERAQVVAAWAQFVASQAQVESDRRGVEANRIALAGVREEERVGQRTLLDVLNAEQKLLNAEVNLMSARRNLVVASYSVFSTTGRLNAQELGVAALIYDPEQNYDGVRREWLDITITHADGRREVLETEIRGR